MSVKPRLELKYRLDPFAYRRVRAVVRGHMRRDRFTRRAPGGAYYVRSLYYDTFDAAAYVEKLAGESSRVKLRLRVYAERAEDAPFVSVELKCREAWAVLKHAVRVPVERYRAFARSGSWVATAGAAGADPVLIAFERHLRRTGQRPAVLVDYRREAFVPRGPGALRLTFDHRVRAAPAADLFAAPRWRSADPHTVVLELKTPDRLPPWLEHLVRGQELLSVPNSKYTQAVEQAYPALLW